MLHRRITLSVFSIFSLLLFVPSAHADWRQFRGKDQRAAAPDAKVPAEWTEAEIAWKAELPGRAASSPIIVDGKLIVCSDRGHVSVVSAGADWQLLSDFRLSADIYATPAFADGRLYIRTVERIYCLTDNASDAPPSFAR